MNHPDGQPEDNALAAYLEATASAAERSRIEEHLARCTECRGTVALYARARQSAKGHAGLYSGRTLSWLAAAAALLLASVVGIRAAFDAAGRDSPPVAEPSKTEPSGAGPAAQIPVPPPPAAKGEGPVAAKPEARAPVPFSRPRSGEPVPRESLSVKRGGARTVAGKTFRLVAGEWVDAAYDSIAGLPVVLVSDGEIRSALLARLPALRDYAALGTKVLVVYQGTVYRFGARGP